MTERREVSEANTDGLRIGILGLGLIGGSLALALQSAGHQVSAFDSDQDTRQRAAADGLQILESPADLAQSGIDLLVLCIPIRAFQDVLAEVAPLISPATLVIDVGSVKQAVQEIVDRNGLADRFVGAHPMSGTEFSGYEASDAELMRDVQWVLTPTEQSPAAGVRLLLGLITTDLAGRVTILSPEVHDQLVARISHVPHLVASALLTSVAEGEQAAAALTLAAGSFRAATRVAGTAPMRTAAMVEENTDAVLAGLDSFIADITKLRSRLAAGEGVSSRLEDAVAARKLFESVSAISEPNKAEPQVIDWDSANWLVQLQDATAGRRIIRRDPQGGVYVV